MQPSYNFATLPVVTPTAAVSPAFVAVPPALMYGAGMEAVMGWQAAYAEAYRRAAEQVRRTAQESAQRTTIRWWDREITLQFATGRNSAAAAE